MRPQNYLGGLKIRKMGIMLIHFIAFNIMSGACAAGIDAMKVYNDWPLYNGQILPPQFYELTPFWKNFFENKGTVQFNHRNLGYLTLAYSFLMLLASRKLSLGRNQRFAVYLVTSAVSLQAVNGILTLLHNTPPHEANLHQLNALIVLSSTIYLIHSCRKPSKLYSLYLKKFI